MDKSIKNDGVSVNALLYFFAFIGMFGFWGWSLMSFTFGGSEPDPEFAINTPDSLNALIGEPRFNNGTVVSTSSVSAYSTPTPLQFRTTPTLIPIESLMNVPQLTPYYLPGEGDRAGEAVPPLAASPAPVEDWRDLATEIFLTLRSPTPTGTATITPTPTNTGVPICPPGDDGCYPDRALYIDPLTLTPQIFVTSEVRYLVITATPED